MVLAPGRTKPDPEAHIACATTRTSTRIAGAGPAAAGTAPRLPAGRGAAQRPPGAFRPELRAGAMPGSCRPPRQGSRSPSRSPRERRTGGRRPRQGDHQAVTFRTPRRGAARGARRSPRMCPAPLRPTGPPPLRGPDSAPHGPAAPAPAAQPVPSARWRACGHAGMTGPCPRGQRKRGLGQARTSTQTMPVNQLCCAKAG